MNIKSISELSSSVSNSFDELLNVSALIEISLKDDSITESDIYHSRNIRLDLLLSSINEKLNGLYEVIDDLSTEVHRVLSSYLPLSGGTLSGGLKIDGTVAQAGLSVIGNNSKTLLQNTYFNNSSPTNDALVKIVDGTLCCSNDIHGCALSAKWC